MSKKRTRDEIITEYITKLEKRLRKIKDKRSEIFNFDNPSTQQRMYDIEIGVLETVIYDLKSMWIDLK